MGLKVDADRAPVRVGDLLTTSATPGHLVVDQGKIADPRRRRAHRTHAKA
jgi:hypothetical protein